MCVPWQQSLLYESTRIGAHSVTHHGMKNVLVNSLDDRFIIF